LSISGDVLQKTQHSNNPGVPALRQVVNERIDHSPSFFARTSESGDAQWYYVVDLDREIFTINGTAHFKLSKIPENWMETLGWTQEGEIGIKTIDAGMIASLIIASPNLLWTTACQGGQPQIFLLESSATPFCVSRPNRNVDFGSKTRLASKEPGKINSLVLPAEMVGLRKQNLYQILRQDAMYRGKRKVLHRPQTAIGSKVSSSTLLFSCISPTTINKQLHVLPVRETSNGSHHFMQLLYHWNIWC